MKVKNAFLILLIFVLAGCAHVISQEALQEVDEDIYFEDILENPDRYIGKSILLGGDIIETRTLSEKTILLVLQRPLGFRKRPVTDGDSKGRFMVESSDFLDPAIYSEGRKVTVAGAFRGKEVRPLGNGTYGYPVIVAKEIYLWPLEGRGSSTRFYFGVGIGTSF